MTTTWIDAAACEDVPQDDVIGVPVGGREIALYSVDGDVFATDNVCTHGHARLCEGFLEGHEIECPLHQGRFDVRTGQPTCAPADAYRALLATDRITFERRDGAIETRTEIVVVPEDAAEVRKVKLRNHGTETVEIELTSYGEVVLGGIEEGHRLGQQRAEVQVSKVRSKPLGRGIQEEELGTLDGHDD